MSRKMLSLLEPWSRFLSYARHVMSDMHCIYSPRLHFWIFFTPHLAGWNLSHDNIMCMVCINLRIIVMMYYKIQQEATTNI